MSSRIGIRAWIDFAFKKIFGKPGNEICLISLLNSVLDLSQPIMSVEFLNHWLKYSHEHTEEELRVLLPGLAFLQATRELSEIREVTEQKQMYDSREKAALDLQSGLIDAREQGLEQGLEQGEIKLIRTLQEILGEPMTAEPDLGQHSLAQLQSIAEELRSRILRRS